MHLTLSKSPLTYVLAQIKFSNIQKIGNHIDEIQDKIRHVFPHLKEMNLQLLQLRENQPPTPLVVNQWHFLDKDMCTGIILDSTSVAIHTSKYNNFEQMSKNFENVLKIINEICEISLFTRIGVRYINFIDSGLNKINPEILGFELPETHFSNNKFLRKMETTQLSQQGIIKVQAAYVGNKEIIVGTRNLFVPPELADGASFLSFMHYQEPKNGFLTLDIDHFNEQQGDFDTAEIIQRLQNLQELSYDVFHAAVGDEILNDWK